MRYGVISSDSEKERLYSKFSEDEIFLFPEQETLLNRKNKNLDTKKVIKTSLTPNIGILEIIKKIPNVLDIFELWIIDGWDKATIYGVHHNPLELPNAKIIIFGTNFYGVEVLRTELTFVDIDEINYPIEISKKIREVLEEWSFEMVRRKAKKLALGLYHFFEQ